MPAQQPGEGWLSGDRLRQGPLGLLLMRLGDGIGKGLINRAGGLFFWAHGKGKVDGGCFSARVGGGVAML